MNLGFRALILTAMISAIVASLLTIFLYEFYITNFYRPFRSRDSLLNLAVVSLYLVAIMLAVLTLGFMVAGRQWIIEIVNTHIDGKLKEVEMRNILRAHGRTAYLLWQLSRGDEVTKEEFLNEAISLSGRCYHNNFDDEEDIESNAANNFAYFLSERKHPEDTKEALGIAARLRDVYYPKSKHSECLFTYAEIIKNCAHLHMSEREAKEERLKAINVMNKLIRQTRSKTIADRCNQMISELNKQNSLNSSEKSPRKRR